MQKVYIARELIFIVYFNMIVLGFLVLFLDIAWWYHLSRVSHLSWLNSWYHLAVYLPLILIYTAGLLLATGIRSLRTSLLILVAYVVFATWLNDFVWHLLVYGDPIRSWLSTHLYPLINLDSKPWCNLHFGTVVCLPWWIFSLLTYIRPIVAVYLLYGFFKPRPSGQFGIEIKKKNMKYMACNAELEAKQ